MKTLLAAATVLALFLLGSLTDAAWAGPRDGDRHGGGRPPHEQQEPPSPDTNGDGRLSTFERIQDQRQDRWNRLHGTGTSGSGNGR